MKKEDGEGKKAERWTIVGAVTAAFISSLCCIGPLLSAVLGLGAFAVASIFAAVRPYLQGLPVAALAFGFYLSYFRRSEPCAPGEVCAKPSNKAGRAGLWLATVAVIAFALSPYYAGRLAEAFGGRAATSPARPMTHEARVTFKVSGMDCASCETTVRLALESVPGVRSAEVSHQRGEAVVAYDPNATTIDKLRDAINQTGYKVKGIK